MLNILLLILFIIICFNLLFLKCFKVCFLVKVFLVIVSFNFVNFFIFVLILGKSSLLIFEEVLKL